MTMTTVNGKSVTFNATGKSQYILNGGSDSGMAFLAPGPSKLTSAVFSLITGGNYIVPMPNITVIPGKKNGNGDVSITNDGTQTAYLESVDAATAIDPSLLSASLSDDITNELYANNPEPGLDGSLAPGATKTVMLSADHGDDYTSVVFTASNDPTFAADDTVTLAFADDVPEPPTWRLLATGVVLTLSLAVRRRRGSNRSDAVVRYIRDRGLRSGYQ